MVRCTFCSRTFDTIGNLHKHQGRVHGLIEPDTCSQCNIELTEQNQRKSHKKRRVPICRDCAGKQTDIFLRNHPSDYNAQTQRDWRKRLRLRTIEAYGGKCECCGESQWEFLTIDHIYGDGAEDFPNYVGKGRLGGASLYRLLEDAGFPRDRYRLLCYNCNCAMGHLGYCPHQQQGELFQTQQFLARSLHPQKRPRKRPLILPAAD